MTVLRGLPYLDDVAGGEGMHHRIRRLGEAGLAGLGHVVIALPALVLELDVLYRHGVGIRIEIGQGLKLGDPAAIDFISHRELAGLVVDLEDDLFAEGFQRYLAAEARAVVPHLVRPLLELGVVGDAAFQRDRLVFGAPRRFARARGIAAFAMLDDLGAAFERTHFRNARDITAVPFDAEFEVLVWIESLCVDGELGHGLLLFKAMRSRNGQMTGIPRSRLYLPRHLLDLDHHELGGFERRETDHDVHDARIDVVLRGGLLVAFDEVGVARAAALECALPNQAVHEGAEIEADLRPQRLVVGLEHHPLRATEQTLFEEEREASHGQVFPFGGELVGAAQGARAPHHAADYGKAAQAIHRERIELAVLAVGELGGELDHAVQHRVVAGRRLPHAALYFPRLRLPDPLQENRLADFAPCGAGEVGHLIPRAERIDHVHGAALFAILRGGAARLRVHVAADIARERRNAEQIEQVRLLVC